MRVKRADEETGYVVLVVQISIPIFFHARRGMLVQREGPPL
jgi:hypothetical protein